MHTQRRMTRKSRKYGHQNNKKIRHGQNDIVKFNLGHELHAALRLLETGLEELGHVLSAVRACRIEAVARQHLQLRRTKKTVLVLVIWWCGDAGC